MTTESPGITEWRCGGCGQVHGWECPYFGHPGKKMTAEESDAARERMAADRVAEKWPFKKSRTSVPHP